MSDLLQPPWAWRKIGGQYHLVQDAGARPVILTAGLDSAGTDDEPRALLLARDDATGALVPVDPDGPAMRLLAAAPDLLAACEAALAHFGGLMGCGALTREEEAPLAALRSAVAKAGGGKP